MAAHAAGSQGALADALGITGGHLTKLLYGDHKAGRALAEVCRVRFGIPVAAWGSAPIEEFHLPVAQPAA